MQNFSFSFDQIKISENLVKSAYFKYGVIVIEDFLQKKTIQSILQEMDGITCNALLELKSHWNNEKVSFFSRNSLSEPHLPNDYITHPYFLQSKDQAHIFFENTANDFQINRIGHGMHLNTQNKTIHSLVYRNIVLQNLLKLVGLKQPICLLSVYIPKLSKGVGSKVRPHQESTFAYTSPTSVVVLWIALEDAEVNNACLWGILGSQKFPLKFISMIDRSQGNRTFKQLHSHRIPDFDLQRSCYTPLAIKAGSALIFHGNFIHCSPQNTSSKSRKALSFQFIETLGVDYPSTNWNYPHNSNYLYGRT